MIELCDSAPKVPHQPELLVGNWAISIGREIFKIEEAYTAGGEASYFGTGLHGQRVKTHCPTLLPLEDQRFMDEHYDPEEEQG